MKFQVEYAHPATGREFVKVVEAESAEAARQMAGRGMLVSGVRKVPTAAGSDREDGAVALSELDEAAADGRKPTPPADALETAVLDYRSGRATAAAGNGAGVPDYKDIVKGAAVLRTFANLWALAGVVIVAGGILLAVVESEWARSSGVDATVASLITVVGALFWCLVCFVVAALIRLVASCSLALRDIAQNSFAGGAS